MDGPKDNAPALGKRQQGLEDRRRRLVKAASELLAERDNGQFSMPDLAERAGVSLATPYNLFGSKAAAGAAAGAGAAAPSAPTMWNSTRRFARRAAFVRALLRGRVSP